MKRVWIAKIVPKLRNRLTDNEFHTIEADSPEELLRKLLKTKHRAWFEIEKCWEDLGKTSWSSIN